MMKMCYNMHILLQGFAATSDPRFVTKNVTKPRFLQKGSEIPYENKKKKPLNPNGFNGFFYASPAGLEPATF